MEGQPINEINCGLMFFKGLIEEDTLASLRVAIAIIAHQVQFEAKELMTKYRAAEA